MSFFIYTWYNYFGDNQLTSITIPANVNLNEQCYGSKMIVFFDIYNYYYDHEAGTYIYQGDTNCIWNNTSSTKPMPTNDYCPPSSD